MAMQQRYAPSSGFGSNPKSQRRLEARFAPERKHVDANVAEFAGPCAIGVEAADRHVKQTASAERELDDHPFGPAGI